MLQAPEASLDPNRYIIHSATTLADYLNGFGQSHDHIDCLVVEADLWSRELLQAFTAQGVLGPTVVVIAQDGGSDLPIKAGSDQVQGSTWAYHGAVVTLAKESISQLEVAIQRAIQQFLELPADSCILPNPSLVDQLPVPDILSAQQGRLTEKLKARLGYLGVYYKRNPENFFRNLSSEEREALLSQLKASYRKIVLGYFTKDAKLNQTIDDLVDQAFLADVSVSYIVEIHMLLMDEFAKQLKLEGRSEEILLDYRLTLIDVMAHLCEMYRRSIPRSP